MTLLRSALRSIGVLAVAQIVMWAVALAFTLAQARYLGPARFGALSVAISYSAFVAIVIDFGLGTQLTRTVAQRKAGRLVSTVVVRAALWLATLSPLFAATYAFGYDAELRDAIFLLAVSTLFAGMASAVGSYLQGREQFGLASLAQVAQRLVAAAVGTAVLLVRPELDLLAGGFVIGSVASLVVLAVGMRREISRPERIDPREALDLFRRTIPLGVYWIATTFYWSVDMIMLERLAPAENVGWYAAAYRLFSVATIPATLVAGIALSPVLARLALGARDELRTVIGKSLTYLILAGTAASLVLALLAEPIVALLYPPSYAPAASALRLLAPALLFIHVNWIFASSLLGLHQERRLLLIAVGAAAFNPLANLVAIPLLREDGAALVTSLTEALLLVCLVRTLPRDLLVPDSARVATKALVAAAATAVAMLPARDAPLLASAPLACVLFGALVFALQAVSKSDLLALRALIRPEGARS